MNNVELKGWAMIVMLFLLTKEFHLCLMKKKKLKVELENLRC